MTALGLLFMLILTKLIEVKTMTLDTLLNSFNRSPEAAKTLIVLVNTEIDNKMEVVPLTMFNFQGGVCDCCQRIYSLEELEVLKAYDAITGQVYYPAVSH